MDPRNSLGGSRVVPRTLLIQEYHRFHSGRCEHTLESDCRQRVWGRMGIVEHTDELMDPRNKVERQDKPPRTFE